MAKKPIPNNRNTGNHVIASHQTVTHYQGAIPPPDLLRGIDEIAPGAAERIIKMAEEEALHRRSLEASSLESNIAAQQRQLLIEEGQIKSVFRSDFLGQIAGFTVCIGCICAAVYLGINNHDWLAGIISAIPTAALIKAFLLDKKK